MTRQEKTEKLKRNLAQAKEQIQESRKELMKPAIWNKVFTRRSQNIVFVN